MNDYQTVRFSLKAHPMRFSARHYAGREVRHRRRLEIRSRRKSCRSPAWSDPSAAGKREGRVFITIEDETGVANMVVWPDVFEKQRKIVMGARLNVVR